MVTELLRHFILSPPPSERPLTIDGLWGLFMESYDNIIKLLLFMSCVSGGEDMIGGNIVPNTSPSSSSQQHQQQHLMQNMESLLESMNTGNIQNINLSQFQILMDSMKDTDFQSVGLDPNQWQELAFSFNQYLQQQGFLPTSSGGMSSLHTSLTSGSSVAGMNSPPNSLLASDPQFSPPLQDSQHSYNSSASYSGSSVQSIPGIRVTQVKQETVAPTMQHGIFDDDVDDFDWDSIM